MSESHDHSPQWFFVGCYTKGAGGEGDGIALALRDDRTGGWWSTGTVATTPAPSFLARHPTRRVLYAVNEVAEGAVSAWSVPAEGGTLEPLGTWATGGSYPCHLAVSTDGRHLLVANYGSGSVAAVPLDVAGVPGPQPDLVVHSGRGRHPERQEAPHTHMVVPDEASDRVLAVDLGADAVYAHRLDPATGRLTAGEPVVRTAPGTGPRRMVRDSDGYVYIIGELDASLTSYVESSSELRQHDRVGTSTWGESLPSEIAVGEDGRFLYVGNRGPDTIATFVVSSGRLALASEVSTGGSWPRHFALVDGFLHVGNERSHTVVTFRLDPATGVPVPTGDVLAVPSPTCVMAF